MTEQLKLHKEAEPPVQAAKDTAGAIEVKEEPSSNSDNKPANGAVEVKGEASSSSDIKPTKEATEEDPGAKSEVPTASDVKENTKTTTGHADEFQEATKDDSKTANGVQETAKDSVSGNAEVNETIKDSVEDSKSKEAPKDAKDTDQENGTKASEDVISNKAGPPSQRVQEGQKWNNRDRDRPDYKKNIKSDLTTQEESNDPVAIRKQVEFYFSDSNLYSDKFLFSKVEGHHNLPVPISIIHSFKRMRHFQPFSAIVTALKESEILNVVENDSCIQRKIPMSENFKDKPMHEIQQVYEDEAMARSVYAKGFGEEQASTQFDIEAFFAKYGSTNSVRLRRAQDKMFKGSVFVEFDTETTQKAFLALDPQPKWKGEDLQIKSKKQYCDEKVEDIRSGRMQPNTKNIPPRGGHKSRGGRGNNDDRDWRARRDDDRKGGFGNRNGVGNRNGGHHKGFGSSGRGGRDGRGGRGGRGGRSDNKRKERDEHNPQVPKLGISSPSDDKPRSHPTPPKAVPSATETAPSDPTPSSTTVPVEKLLATPMDTAADVASKKRSREAVDGDADVQGKAKKADIKTTADS